MSEYVPWVEVGDRAPTWICSPPRSLVQRRSAAWRNFKRSRANFGRSSEAAELAWERFSAVNVEYRSFTLRQRWDHEIYLAQSLACSPELFHSYIRRKKRGCCPVGPLKIDGEVVSCPERMAEIFADGFESVFVGSVPVSSNNHQVALSEMSPLLITYGAVLRVAHAVRCK